MDSIEILKSAIQQKKQINYEYVSAGMAVGQRVGNPHAIFISTTNSVNIDIYKTAGVKTDPAQPLPGWRQYRVKDIKNVKVMDEEFSVAEGYNPGSKQYVRVITQIK